MFEYMHISQTKDFPYDDENFESNGGGQCLPDC